MKVVEVYWMFGYFYSLFGVIFGSRKFGSFQSRIIIAQRLAFANTLMDLFAK